MSNPFLLSRVLLQFNSSDEDLINELSAATFTPDGSLWLGADEGINVERLSLIEPCVFGNHQSYCLADFIELFNQDDEIDIEGIDHADNYLWITGSHSTKRGKPKGKNVEKDIQRLATIKTDVNRYLLTRIPIVNGELLKVSSLPDNPEEKLTAACLQKTDASNSLIDALIEDIHLGPFVTHPLPSKDNGLDIEGLAVRGDRVFLGCRGPVLRGWAVIIEIKVAESAPGILTLQDIGDNGKRYLKHFIDLNGLGVRELCWQGDDLLILAGPTMDLEGAIRVFRLTSILDRSADSITGQAKGELERLFDLPFIPGYDRAEGLALFPCLGESDALLMVYDSPNPIRQIEPSVIYGDVFSGKIFG